MNPIVKVDYISRVCGSPSIWTGRTVDDHQVLINYNHGVLVVLVNDEILVKYKASVSKFHNFMTYDELKLELAPTLELPDVSD